MSSYFSYLVSYKIGLTFLTNCGIILKANIKFRVEEFSDNLCLLETIKIAQNPLNYCIFAPSVIWEIYWQLNEQTLRMNISNQQNGASADCCTC